jgi:hypothetical protein
VALAVIGVVSSIDSAPDKETPESFWDVVRNWGQTWLWDNLVIAGDIEWIADAIRENTLVAVTDGSYMEDRYPFLNSAAFIFECSRGRGKLMGSFIEYTPDACAYRGELLGLMAIRTAWAHWRRWKTFHHTESHQDVVTETSSKIYLSTAATSLSHVPSLM